MLKKRMLILSVFILFVVILFRLGVFTYKKDNIPVSLEAVEAGEHINLKNTQQVQQQNHLIFISTPLGSIGIL